MDIANNKFSFNFSENNVTLPDYFKDNEDFKINYEKALKSRREIMFHVKLNLCKDKFLTFSDYLFFDLDSSKKLFYADLKVGGIMKEVLCDIVSNPLVSAKNNNYTITFDLVLK